MHLASRFSISFWFALLTLALVSPALAGGRGGGPAHHERPGAKHGSPAVTQPHHRPGEELNRPGEKRRGRRGCRRGVRRGPGIHCDYYYDDDSGPEASAPVREAARPQPAPAAAKIAPRPHDSDGVVESYTPTADKELKERLISARKNWLDKKNRLDAANAARAKAEYRASQTGSSVDPAIVARQDEAKREAATAHAAIAPLVEEGRAAGIAPEVLDLYERANSAD